MTNNMTAEIAQAAVGRYAEVNGLHLYYEIYGSGRPLVLLHGGFGGTGMFAALLPILSTNRQVIAVELQGHGHTADIDRPLRYELMADDVAALIGHLGLAEADVMGYSLGGGVALQTAIRHPSVVRKLVLASTVFQRDGWYPEDLAGMALVNGALAQTWTQSPMYAAYAAAAPRPADWPVLADKMGELLRRDYDWKADVAAITAPTLIVIGDADGIRPAHAVALYQLVGGGRTDGPMGGLPQAQLAILPATTHLSILERTELLQPIIGPFLDAPMPERR